jgi:hypothetical protein
MMEEKAKPIFHKRIFWDVDFEKLNYDAKANFVIERVLREVMSRISVIAEDTMEMKRWRKHY